MSRVLLAAALFAVTAGTTAPAWAPPARAQQHEPLRMLLRQQGAQPGGGVEVVPAAEGHDAQAAPGLSTKRMLHRPVYGGDGAEIGTLKDLHIGYDGEVEALVVESGGLFGIAGAPVRIPWEGVEVAGEGKDLRIVVPVTGEAVDGSEPSGGKVEPGPRAFKASELIGSYTLLDGGETYGQVADIVIDGGGGVTAVAIEPAYGYRERYGYPYDARAAPHFDYAPGREREYADPTPGAVDDGAAGFRPYDFEAMGVRQYQEVEVDPATGELVIEEQTGGDEAQPGNAAGIHLDR